MLCWNIQDLANLATVFGVIGIGLAWWQLRRTKQTEEARFWLELRKTFDEHEYVISKIARGGEWVLPAHPPYSFNQKDERMVYRYLGQLELCEVMIQKGLLNRDIFNRQHGYKVRHMVENVPITQLVSRHSAMWTDLIDLAKHSGFGNWPEQPVPPLR